jgi:predicted Zn-dependent peptidase
MRKISHDYLREKLGLIYSSHIATHSGLSFNKRIVGYELIIQPENYDKVLESLNDMLEKKIEKFLNSKEGEIWFESAISRYIFPRNIPYRTNYAERKALPILEDAEVFELDKGVKEALKISMEDVSKYIKEFFNNTPLFWIESDSEGKKLIKRLEKSKLYNRL